MLRLIVMLSLVFAVAFPCPANAPPGKAAADAKTGSNEAVPLRVREGETVELVGKMELAGDRAVFHPSAGGVQLRVLENLALERITRILNESRDDREWIVAGTITEYRGGNYILINKAVQRARKDVLPK
jgi:hypothetical protein